MKHRQLFLVGIWLSFLFLSRFLHFNLPVGSHSATLSCFSVMLPLLAAFLPATRSLPLIALVWIGSHLTHPIPITAGIPTLLASLSWRYSRNRSLHCLLPLLAMALFIASPSGKGAALYTFYWLIPIACSFLRPNLFTRALSSTFVAHAAGSVIWAYFVPMTSIQWLSLIPVVAIERLLSASLSVVGIMALSALYRSSLKNWFLSV